MKATEIQKLSLEELKAQEIDLRKQLFDLKSQAVTQKLENPRKLGEIRKDIARIQTVRQIRSSKKDA